MTKKLLFVLALTSFAFLNAMTVTRKLEEDEILITLTIEGQGVVLPLSVVSNSATITGILEDVGTDEHIPLPNITIEQWRLVEPALAIISDKKIDAIEKKDKLGRYLESLSLSELHLVITSANFLDISQIYKQALSLIEPVELIELSVESFLELPRLDRNDLILQMLTEFVSPERCEQLAQCVGHEAEVERMFLLPEGRIASYSGDYTIRIWDSVTGEQLACCEGAHPYRYGIPNQIVVLPNNSIALVSENHEILIWNCSTGKLSARCEGHEEAIDGIELLPNGNIVSYARDHTIRIWDSVTGQEVFCCNGHEQRIEEMFLSPDGIIVSQMDDSTLCIWDSSTGKLIARCEGHEEEIEGVTILPDGRIASCSSDGIILIWDSSTGEELARCQNAQSDGSPCPLLVFSNDVIALRCSDNSIRSWNTFTGGLVASFIAQNGEITEVGLLPDESLLSGFDDGTIHIWDTSTGRQLVCYEVHEEEIEGVAILPDGRIASYSQDNISIWDTSTGQEIVSLDSQALNHTFMRKVLSLFNGKIVVSLCGDIASIWHIATGEDGTTKELLFSIQGTTELLLLSGDRIALGMSDGSVTIWDVSLAFKIKAMTNRQAREVLTYLKRNLFEGVGELSIMQAIYEIVMRSQDDQRVNEEQPAVKRLKRDFD